MSICVKNDATYTWHKLPYLVAKDDIMWVISKWPRKWVTPYDLGIGTSKAIEGEPKKTIATLTTMKEINKEAQKAYAKESDTVKEKVAQQKEVSTKEMEAPKEKVSTKETEEPKEKGATMSQATIGLDESEIEHNNVEDEIEGKE